MKISFIYALIDPRSDEIRYIGKSKNPNKRLKYHLLPSQLKPNTHKNNWLKELISLNLKPNIKILAKCKLENENSLERKYITLHKKKGCKLTNGTSGGDGWPRGQKMADTEARRNIYTSVRKAVIIRNKITEEELLFSSVKEAAEFIKCDNTILSCILNKKPEFLSAKGYYARFAHESFVEPQRKIPKKSVIATNIETGESIRLLNSKDGEKYGFGERTIRQLCEGTNPYRHTHKGYKFRYE